MNYIESISFVTRNPLEDFFVELQVLKLFIPQKSSKEQFFLSVTRRRTVGRNEQQASHRQ
jgi:hypothetical protein